MYIILCSIVLILYRDTREIHFTVINAFIEVAAVY